MDYTVPRRPYRRMLFAGTSDQARAVFAAYAPHRPAAWQTIRQRSRVLDQGRVSGHCRRASKTSRFGSSRVSFGGNGITSWAPSDGTQTLLDAV
jgi:hypothetical protein